jgi:GINS complex subunit 2
LYNSSSASIPITTLSNNDTLDWKRHASSAFLAGDELVECVPSFSTDMPLELLSVVKLGPLRAGIPISMPLWLALLLEKRNLANISAPTWLSVDNLKAVLEWEQTRETFSPALPYYWQPLARHLGKDEAVKILLQDIAMVRMDKIRRNLHTLSKQSLSSESTLPIVTITGIGALELASIHSFVQMSFHQHLKLSRPSISSNSNNNKSAEETRRDAAMASRTKNGENEGDSDSEGEEEEQETAAAAPSRLRRFR